MGKATRRWWPWALAVAVGLAGWAVPGGLPCESGGVAGADPLRGARGFDGGTPAAVLTRRRCVAEVREVRGACRTGAADRVVRVEAYTWGGLRRSLFVGCSGVDTRAPDGWERSAPVPRSAWDVGGLPSGL